MIGTINCVYETPCGWCSKWDKKCDRKSLARGARIKIKPIDDAIDTSILEAVKRCVTESDHVWEPAGISTEGCEYICKKCGAKKID